LFQIKNKALSAKFALFLAPLIWGFSFVVTKSTVDVLPVFFLLAVRFSIAFVFLSIIFKNRLKQIDKKIVQSGGVIGVYLFIAYALQTFGITDTTPGKNAFLTTIYCIIVPFLFWLTGKIKPDVFNIISATLCLLGVGLVSIKSDLTIGKGDLLTMLSGVFFAAHIVAIKRFSKDFDPIVLTIVQFGYCAIFSSLFSLVFEPRVTSISADMIGSIIYLSVGCTAIGLLLQTIGQKYTPPSSAAIILSLESVFGVTFSVILKQEVISLKLVIGFFMIFISIIISETKLSFLFNRKSL
jgi:drug/metabolite transporter (DMT)-like permease